MKRITYKFEVGEHTLLARQGIGDKNMSKSNIEKLKNRYAEKWGVNPDDINVSRKVTEETKA